MTSKWWVICSQKNSTSPVGVFEVQRLTNIQISETESQPKHLSESEKESSNLISFLAAMSSSDTFLEQLDDCQKTPGCCNMSQPWSKMWQKNMDSPQAQELRLQHTLDYRLYIVNSNSWNFCALKRFLFAINPQKSSIAHGIPIDEPTVLPPEVIPKPQEWVGGASAPRLWHETAALKWFTFSRDVDVSKNRGVSFSPQIIH